MNSKQDYTQTAETHDNEISIEHHPLQPFLPENTRILMLGSFPPARQRWCMDFFYPNFINDMWRIFGIVFFNEKEHFVNNEEKVFRKDDIITFLKAKGIGLYDTARTIHRTKNTASDKDLEVITQTDISNMLKLIPLCHTIVTTGEKATSIIAGQFNINTPKTGETATFVTDNRKIKLTRMPSSSRAYPMNITKKAEIYGQMFRNAGLL